MTLQRRFAEGDRWEFGDAQYRIVRGRKHVNDLKIERRFIGAWQPVALDEVGLIVDAIADNENVLYPPPAKGGAYVHRFLTKALRDGWCAARAELQRQRAAKQERLEAS